MSLIAPAGTPISILDILSWMPRLFRSKHNFALFKQDFEKKFQLKNSFYISTGRAAMSLALKCMAASSKSNNNIKNEIIIPSYTCYSVPSSIIQAGLKVRICDIDPKTLSYDREKLSNFDFSKTLAIVTANLYGIPNELDFIREVAHQNNIYLLDDAAQCMGGKVKGEYSGTIGDIGLFSLDKGKNFTSMQGGIITSNSEELTKLLKSEYTSLPSSRNVTTLKDCIKLLAYSAILPPHAYWITKSLPFLNLGATAYEKDTPVSKYSPTLGAFAKGLFNKFDSFTDNRNINAKNLSKKIQDINKITLIKHKDYIQPVYIRLPILAKDNQLREQIIKDMLNNGITATRSYPKAICDIPEIQMQLHKDDKIQSGGQYIAERIVTLPIHPYVKEKHLDIMTSTLSRSCSV